MGCPVNYFEIPTADTGKAKEFYNNLFDWGFKEYPGDYYEIEKADNGLSGGLHKADFEKQPHHVMIYVQVDDLQRYLDKANELGGKTIVPPTNFSEEGAFAVMTDPEGCAIGLWQQLK